MTPPRAGLAGITRHGLRKVFVQDVVGTTRFVSSRHRRQILVRDGRNERDHVSVPRSRFGGSPDTVKSSLSIFQRRGVPGARDGFQLVQSLTNI